jgi:hypothetical protein
MAIPSSPAPPVGTVGVGELLADAQTKTMWLGVPPSVDAAQAVLVGDIVGLLQGDAATLTAANAFTTSGLAGKSNTGHHHAISDVDGLTAALADNAGAVPSGGIILWSGSLGTIPGGWTLCNGSNGTPDLRDRFVLGAGGSTGSALQVGGAKNRTVASDLGGAHTPTGAVGYHVLTLAELASHAHAVYDPGHAHGISDPGHAHSIPGSPISIAAGVGLAGGSNYAVTSRSATAAVGTGISIAAAATGIAIYGAGSDNGHNHPLSMNAVGGHQHNVTFDVMPPYIILGYIMRI